MWNSEELEAEADGVYCTVSGLEGGGAEVWSLALALLLGPGRVKCREQVAQFRKQHPKVWMIERGKGVAIDDALKHSRDFIDNHICSSAVGE